MERIQKYINRIYRASILDRQEHFKDKGLAGQQLSYILQIVRSPGLSQDEIARSLLVNKSSVARNISNLEAKGFLFRQVNPEDNRIKQIYPTAKAEAIYPEIINYLENWNEILVQDLSCAEREEVVVILKKLASSASVEVRQEIYAAEEFEADANNLSS